MSSLNLTISADDLKRLDERVAAVGGSRESLAVEALRARLDEPLPAPEISEPVAEEPKRSRRRSFTDLPSTGEEKE